MRVVWVVVASILLIAPIAARAQSNADEPQRRGDVARPSDPERRGDDVHPAGPQSAPEIDINSAASALGLLIAALLVMRGRRDAMD